MGVPGQRRRAVDGIVLIDKPPGLSSNQALQKVKRLFRARKAGHTGSLDPLATGMLPICLGQATKVSAYLLDSDKTYLVKVAFGARTTTGDAEGAVVEEGGSEVGASTLEDALARMRGRIMQIPPMYSAIHHEGRRLYQLAREGRVVERAPREVWIHELVVESWDPHAPVLRVRCSKGTYIRTLVEDLAAAAGTVGHVAGLRRLAVEPFSDHAMCTLGELALAAEAGETELARFLLPVDTALVMWPAVHVEEPDAARLRHGQVIRADPIVRPGLVRLYGGTGRFLGVGECEPGGRIVPRRLMVDLAQLPAGDGL
jgi:tRNA pseudouridine55 synthase